MKQTKLVSVRLDEDDLAIIDEFCGSLGYRSRSNVIGSAVKFMAWAIKERKQGPILMFCPDLGDIVDKFEFKYHRGHR